MRPVGNSTGSLCILEPFLRLTSLLLVLGVPRLCMCCSGADGDRPSVTLWGNLSDPRI